MITKEVYFRLPENYNTCYSMRKHFNSVLFLVLILIISVSCRTAEPMIDEPEKSETEKLLDTFFSESDIFSQSNTGFVLFDPKTDSTLYGRDAQRFFTPASNIKAFTLYAALNTLPDTLAALRYEVRDDTLYFRGTGNPSFLHPELNNGKAFEFLNSRTETLIYDDAHFKDDHFGSGWPWDWYPQAYAPEKTPFPVYGNMIRLNRRNVALVMLDEENPVEPSFFEKYLETLQWNSNQSELVKRDLRENKLTYAPKSDTVGRVQNMPFVYSPGLITELLADTLNKPVYYQNTEGLNFSSVLYDSPAVPMYIKMMHESDNFIAEQLLLLISDELYGEMNTMKAINYVLENYLNEFKDQFRWADGSGLTRYNLITPNAMAGLKNRFLKEYGEEAVKKYFPAGGQSGTLRSWYRPADGEEPYVYAKTGTLRNNTSLSGYIYTDSGRLLIFSFLNNNYIVSNNAIRIEMQNALNLIKSNL